MTRIRKLLLRYINDATQPLTANDIFVHSNSEADLATIYRALHYFEQHGFVESFSYHCEKEGTLRYYYPMREEHTHFFHCASCHMFIPLGPCMLHTLEEELQAQYNVEISRHVLYFTGFCKECAEKKNKNPCNHSS